MASVENTVRTAITCFPSLFDSRTAVLQHVLCVIGNGYRWQDGEAISEFPDDDVPWSPEKYRAGYTEWVDRTFSDIGHLPGGQSIVDKMIDENEKRLAQLQQIVDTVEDLHPPSRRCRSDASCPAA